MTNKYRFILIYYFFYTGLGKIANGSSKKLEKYVNLWTFPGYEAE